ncbi:MAG: hypothetical protein JWR80_8811 [Bradyrhizobium sp.]|nr:hypothetical protein [Bradyrhizobium sp.]
MAVSAIPSPLGGVRVAEVGNGVAAGFCASLLAKLGADVTVFGADKQRFAEAGVLASAMRSFVDGGKTLRGDEGVTLHQKFAAFDVVLLSGVISRADRRAIASLAPGLICAHFTTFGDIGPNSADAGTELKVQAMSGLLALLGAPDREPLMLPQNQVAYCSGCMAFSAIMAALAFVELGPGERRGQWLEISDLEVMTYVEWKGGVYSQFGGTIPRGRETGPLILRCRDGHFALYYANGHWPAIKALFGNPAELDDPRFESQQGRMAAEAELKQLLEAITVSRDKHELYRAAQALRIPAGAVETLTDLLDSPQYAARRYLHSESGDIAIPRPPCEMNGIRPGATGSLAPASEDGGVI